MDRSISGPVAGAASKGFSRSGRQSAFLDYVVTAALEGRADRLKEFTLGIEVFEKDESFDPSVDSIVRVEATRLSSGPELQRSALPEWQQ